MCHHFTPTFHIIKELMNAVIFLIPALTNTSPQRHYVIYYVWSSPSTISRSTISIIFKSMVLLWVLTWLLLLPTFFLVCSKLTLSLTPLIGSPTHGEDISMIFYDLDRRSRFLKIFVDYLNNIHPTIKFTSSHSLTNAPFFDVIVSLHNGIIETDLFTKPSQLIMPSSPH